MSQEVLRVVSDAASRILERAIQEHMLKLRVDRDGVYRAASFEGNDEQFRALCELKELREVNCSHASITNAAFSFVSKLTNLTTLKFFDNDITGSAYSALPLLRNLRQISCKPMSETAEAAAALAKCVNLRLIDVAQSRFTNADVQALLSLPLLEELNLEDCPLLSDGCLEDVGTCPSLTRVVVSHCSIGDITCRHLAGSNSIRLLNLGATSVTGNGLEMIGRLPLTFLGLGRNPQLTTSDINRLGSCPHLEILSLSDTPVDDDVVPYLLSLESLKNLDVLGTRLSQVGIDILSKRNWRFFAPGNPEDDTSAS